MQKQQTFLLQVFNQLRHFREAAGLSQTEIASKLQVSYRTYQRYELGDSTPSVDFLFQVSKVLNVPIEEFIGQHHEQKLNNTDMSFNAELDHFRNQLCLQIRLRREELGLKQTSVAERLGVSTRSFQRYENGTGTPSIKQLYALAKILQTDLLSFVNPLLGLKDFGNVEVFMDDREQEFTSLPWVIESGLLHVREWFLRQQKNRVDHVLDNVSFIGSSESLFFSNLTDVVTNPTAQTTLLRPLNIPSGRELHKLCPFRILLWGTLIQLKPKYFLFTQIEQTPSGPVTVTLGGAYFCVDESHFLICCQPRLS